MGWFRTHIGVGSRLALFALAIQVVVSFGHVHLDRLTTGTPAAAASFQQSDSRGGTPPAHRGDADDVCAICAVIGLVASSVLPEAAQLVPPVAVSAVWTDEFVAAAPVFDLHAAFQARAPPTVG